MDGVATLEELDGRAATYNVADVYKANSLLDMRADIEAHHRQQQER